MAAPTVTVGILTGGSNSHTTTSEEVNAIGTDFVSEGIVGTFTNTSGVSPATGAFAVNASGTPDANVNLSTGVAYVTATPTSQGSQTLRVKCTVTGTLAIAANSSGSTKYDWIYISVSATNAANPAVGADNVATIVASRSSSASTDDGTPPTYGYPIAVVTVANGFTTITNGNIRDVRANSAVNLGSSSVSSGWLDLGFSPNTVTALGNHYYSLVFNSTNLTSTVSPGMKVRSTRIVAAPTQCADLESSSSQYFSKTTPSGVTFTDDHTEMGWIKLESYVAGGIIARRNADTEGWSLSVNAFGQVVAGSYRIASNNSVTTSALSLPLNKWVHVAATTDLSGTSVIIYIDGIAVSSTTVITGTITALVQGTTALVVGAEKSAGTNPFDGKIAQPAVFSAVLSAATILSYMSQGLLGSETNLVSGYSLSNSINDLTANANNLSAQGSAVATNADGPFGGQADGTVSATVDYAEIITTTFSTNTTLVVRASDFNTIPTSGGVSAVSYSTQDSPYGMLTFGNVIGMVQLGADFTSTTTGSFADVTGLSITLYMPPNKKVELVIGQYFITSTAAAGTFIETSINDVTSGVEVARTGFTLPTSSYAESPATGIVTLPPASGLRTYKAQFKTNAAGTYKMSASTTLPAFIVAKKA